MSDKMREEFEEWYLREYFEGDEQCGMEWLSTEQCGGYRHAEPSRQWKVWQASRAALVVGLPFEFVNGMMRADQVAAAIESAGVRVKP